MVADRAGLVAPDTVDRLRELFGDLLRVEHLDCGHMLYWEDFDGTAAAVVPFLRAGLNVTVNTDNRLMSHVLPSTELHAVATAGDLTWAEIERLVTNGLASAFAPWSTRQRLLATTRQSFAPLATPHPRFT